MGNSTTISITVVGDVNTGKSTLVSNFTNKNYRLEQYHSHTMGTMTIEHITDINNTMYKLLIYDTSGASFKQLHSLQLCNRSDAVIVCFDAHSPQTYQKAKRWIHDIQENHNPVIVLVGTYTYIPQKICVQHNVMLYASSQSIAYHSVGVQFPSYNETKSVFSSVITQVANKKIIEKIEKYDKNEPSKHKNNIDEFLTKHKLQQYTEYLKEQGYEAMSDLRDMSLNDVIPLRMKRPHKKKLFRALGKSTQVQVSSIHPVHLVALKPLQKSHGALSINIILLGDSGVGKTTLVKKLETNLFDEFVSATIGVEYHEFKALRKHRKNAIEVTLIDPSGMEKYHSLTHQSYRNIHGAILVADICDKESWNHITFWRKELKEHCHNDDVQVILLCNKMDKFVDDEKLSDEIIQRASTYAKHHTFKNYNTSSKDEQYGKQVRKAFEELVASIIYDNTLFRRLKKERSERTNMEEDSYEPFGYLSPTPDLIVPDSPSINVDGRLIPIDLSGENHRRGGRCNCNM